MNFDKMLSTIICRSSKDSSDKSWLLIEFTSRSSLACLMDEDSLETDLKLDGGLCGGLCGVMYLAVVVVDELSLLMLPVADGDVAELVVVVVAFVAVDDVRDDVGAGSCCC